MLVVVNGQDQTLDLETTVGALVAAHRFNPKHVAVEVNEELVPRRLYESRPLGEGDRVEIVTLVGGG